MLSTIERNCCVHAYAFAFLVKEEDDLLLETRWCYWRRIWNEKKKIKKIIEVDTQSFAIKRIGIFTN